MTRSQIQPYTSSLRSAMASVFNISPDNVSVTYTQTASGVTMSFGITSAQVFTPEMQAQFQTVILEIPGFRELLGIQGKCFLKFRKHYFLRTINEILYPNVLVRLLIFFLFRVILFFHYWCDKKPNFTLHQQSEECNGVCVQHLAR